MDKHKLGSGQCRVIRLLIRHSAESGVSGFSGRYSLRIRRQWMHIIQPSPNLVCANKLILRGDMQRGEFTTDTSIGINPLPDLNTNIA